MKDLSIVIVALVILFTGPVGAQNKTAGAAPVGRKAGKHSSHGRPPAAVASVGPTITTSSGDQVLSATMSLTSTPTTAGRLDQLGNGLLDSDMLLMDTLNSSYSQLLAENKELREEIDSLGQEKASLEGRLRVIEGERKEINEVLDRLINRLQPTPTPTHLP